MNLHSILKEYWGYDKFRPLQEEIIRSVLDGKDTLALLPTGGGKSICFQVPVMAMDGLCLVISPLIALMKDQVENLRRKNITAFAIYSGMSRKEVVNTLQLAANSNCKFLYLSPERLETKLFLEHLPALGVSMIAVDEAHCISQWGYDFRPPYLRIAKLREELPGIPMLAVTASATALVQQDICEKLHLHQPSIFRQSFERPNLSYSAFNESSKVNKLVDILSKVHGTSIVYCRSRKKTKEIAELLILNGIPADYYHAGLSSEDRALKQDAWMKDHTRVIVCTNAFGMGIDKPNVRSVIHMDVPECLENYYQEAGRAGRDGLKSYAVLLYNEEDLADLEKSAETKFPALEEIRQVYQYLVNYLQLPEGAGEGMYLEFDLMEFIRSNRLNGTVAIASIKALEQEGYLGYSDQVFLPPRVQFTCDKHYLHEFEKINPALDNVIKTLLRTYEGIFDQGVAINEKYLAYLLKQDLVQTTRELKMLHNAGVIDYQQQKDTPQLYFLVPRVKVSDLSINMAFYRERMKLYLSRVKAIRHFAISKNECRSRMLAIYFGDKDAKDCGICDNCLSKKRQPLSNRDFDIIRKAIAEILAEGSIETNDLYAKLPHIKKDNLSSVLRFLQTENIVQVDRNGKVGMAGTGM